MIKTRLQAQTIGVSPEDRSLLRSQPAQGARQPLNAYQLARQAYRENGLRVFYRGLGVCSIRAFIVNAVQVRLDHLQWLYGKTLTIQLVGNLRVAHEVSPRTTEDPRRNTCRSIVKYIAYCN
ncbi:hypothetical protein P168DRAFT_65161 [Aspergillus campestris IBT 28561]|uniref:Mitochondrial carrier n=1 Tax=Aspergillus campestris (strain IBT 28561) TaxID=1392248 RepID=A0A2I1CTA2_ASPC2|nr:uncharacterized protein P168DRAFT_65161 [Aspergillus campestris IBT 28561]PKY00841.1 hypothetical protein P168DRAFT_65161 [Aspergillus campestris IBT 28561]